jgi:hypothetical protein
MDIIDIFKGILFFIVLFFLLNLISFIIGEPIYLARQRTPIGSPEVLPDLLHALRNFIWKSFSEKSFKRYMLKKKISELEMKAFDLNEYYSIESYVQSDYQFIRYSIEEKKQIVDKILLERTTQRFQQKAILEKELSEL